VSAATAWEISIKRATETLTAPPDLEAQVGASRFDPLPITIGHASPPAPSPDITMIRSTGCWWPKPLSNG
jgi:PIN domain nuclease of toxin-antitoxin system